MLWLFGACSFLADSMKEMAAEYNSVYVDENDLDDMKEFNNKKKEK